MHPDTPTVFVVVAGQLHFDVEGQEPATAARGAIVNIMKSTAFGFEVTGDQNALWVEVNPTNYKTVYPAAGSEPPPSKDGTVVKVSFAHTPAPYTPPNRFMYNTFTPREWRRGLCSRRSYGTASALAFDLAALSDGSLGSTGTGPAVKPLG
jgi:hypothetical protein